MPAFDTLRCCMISNMRCIVFTNYFSLLFLICSLLWKRGCWLRTWISLMQHWVEDHIGGWRINVNMFELVAHPLNLIYVLCGTYSSSSAIHELFFTAHLQLHCFLEQVICSFGISMQSNHECNFLHLFPGVVLFLCFLNTVSYIKPLPIRYLVTRVMMELLLMCGHVESSSLF